jgi:nitroreductase family protein
MPTGNLEAWTVTPSDFPATAALLDKARFAVRYAILAPSSHNTQPWRFVGGDRELLICADRTRSLPNIDPFDRELIISCGAALFNLRVALAHFLIPVEITTFPYSAEPDVVARIAFPDSGPALKELAGLFGAITSRATNRGPYIMEDMPDVVIERLKSAAELEGLDVAFARTLTERERVARLVAAADRQQFDDPRFRRELASWIHSSRRDDGMPAFSQGFQALSDFANPIAAMIIRTFDVGEGVAATHEQLARGAPLLVALSSPADDNQGWLATGMGLQHLLLVATELGYSASYLNQPIEVPDFRSLLAAELRTAADPQVLLRVGRGAAAVHSPRRPLSDVLF